MTVRELLRMARGISSQPPPGKGQTVDAEALLAHLLERSRSWLYAHPEEPVGAEVAALYESLLERYTAGEPIEYVLGYANFRGVTIEVTPAVLVPRPETEVLVDAALAELARFDNSLVADVGTGSGVIAVAIAKERPLTRVIATDISQHALAVAARNVQRLALEDRVWLLCCDLMAPISARFDLVVANLPYVATTDLNGAASPVSKHEPRLALDGGPDGLRMIERLLHASPAKLAPGGVLLAEIGSMQGERALELARRSFPESQVDVLPDWSGLDRILRVRTAP